MAFDRSEVLEVLACEIDVRPRGAPSLDEIRPYVRSVERSAGGVQVTFAADAAEVVTAFVEAERMCCAELDWQLELSPLPVLLIAATPAQLGLLEQAFKTD